MEQKPSISWQALAFEWKPKSIDWYWAFGIIVVASAVACFFYDNFLFGISILITGSLIIFTAHKEPGESLCEIDQDGFSINNKNIPWEDIISYNIRKDGEKKIILIRRNRGINRIISFPIIHIDETSVENTIKSYTTKDENLFEGFGEKLFDYFGI